MRRRKLLSQPMANWQDQLTPEAPLSYSTSTGSLSSSTRPGTMTSILASTRRIFSPVTSATMFSTWVPRSPRQFTPPERAGSQRHSPCLPPWSSSWASHPWGYSAITARTVADGAGGHQIPDVLGGDMAGVGVGHHEQPFLFRRQLLQLRGLGVGDGDGLVAGDVDARVQKRLADLKMGDVGSHHHHKVDAVGPGASFRAISR